MLSFFPRDVFDETWDLTETVSEGFLPTLVLKFVLESRLVLKFVLESRLVLKFVSTWK